MPGNKSTSLTKMVCSICKTNIPRHEKQGESMEWIVLGHGEYSISPSVVVLSSLLCVNCYCLFFMVFSTLCDLSALCLSCEASLPKDKEALLVACSYHVVVCK